MGIALLSLGGLLIFAGMASANFKRLAPLLAAIERHNTTEENQVLTGSLWMGSWGKLALLFWSIGISTPLLSFAISAYVFLPPGDTAGNLVMGATVGSNAILLTLGLSVIFLSGPLGFFRVRSVTSPVFLLLATVAFAYTCLDQRLSVWEGGLLLFLLLSYALYFRTFSSEWKQTEKNHLPSVDATEGFLPLLALICLGVGFFLLSILAAYPLVRELGLRAPGEYEASAIGAHGIGLTLALPWILSTARKASGNSSAKALALSSLSHSCLLNVLFLPAMVAFLGSGHLSHQLVALHIPVALLLTGVLVAVLLVEKEEGGRLPYALTGAYLAYSAWSLIPW
jgi:Ca2+/Na+ antiporter